jgi:glycine/D-amino acid oxidase-like deaminating enzyme
MSHFASKSGTMTVRHNLLGTSTAAAALLVIAGSRSCQAFSTLAMSVASAATNPKNIVVVGGGIQGTSVAYHLATSSSLPAGSKITVLEAKEPASAASGKGGGFMARSWGDGGNTQQLHHLAFDMYETLAAELGCETYRKLPVLSVRPGFSGEGGAKKARKSAKLGPLVPGWLDGSVGPISALGYGDDTAQITPREFVQKALEKAGDAIEVRLGTCEGVDTEQGSERGSRKITGVRYVPRDSEDGAVETIPADDVIVSAGPWSCAAEDWFQGAVELPMEGVKSTSIVWRKPEGMDEVDATALFCGEDNRFGTHLEVYPRPDDSIYICGIGGSDYISKEELKAGAYREVCEANESRVEAASASFREMSATYKAKGELDRAQACMRPCPPDAQPYMGSVPGFEGAYVNAGHNCWGIAWAPACGKAMAELVLDGESTSVDLRPFDPVRFTPVAKRGGRGRKRQGESVGEQW